MANIHGKNTSVALVDAAGVSRNISGDGNNCTLSESVNNPENTGFGDNSVQRAGSGLNDAKFSYEGWANDAADTNLALLTGSGIKGYITLLTYGPAGSATGAVKYSACMLIDDGEVRTSPEGLAVARASFSLASGSVTKGTY